MEILFAALAFVSAATAQADNIKAKVYECTTLTSGSASPLSVELSLAGNGGTGHLMLPYIEGALACASKRLDSESREVSYVGILQVERMGDDRIVKLELSMGKDAGKGIISGKMIEETALPSVTDRYLKCEARN